MALVEDDTYLVSVAVSDKEGKARSVSVRYAATNTIANVRAEVTGTLIPAIQGLINGAIVSYNISVGAKDPDVTIQSISEASDVERKLVYVLSNSVNTSTKYEIPSVDNSHINDGSNIAIANDPAVIAFFTALTVAGVDGLAAVDSAGGALGNLKSPPHKIHRGNTKG